MSKSSHKPSVLWQSADGESAKQNLADMALAKEMSETLQRHYPNHSWGVHVDKAKGMATIRNFKLSGKWGFVLHLGATYSASEMDKRLVMAAGELLERYKLSRGRLQVAEVESLQLDHLGNAEFDK